MGSSQGMEIPMIFQNKDGELLSVITINQSRFRLLLMEYVDGENFHQLGIKPNLIELDSIVQIACKISKIDYRPPFIYDKWAIMNFSGEFSESRQLLNLEQIALIEPIYAHFCSFDLDSLPKAFVHGDISSTNIIKDKQNALWLIDFSVANYMARITEIVVICSDLALIIGEKEKSELRIEHCFELWCKTVNATRIEKESFLLMFSVASAINVMNTAIELLRGNNSAENIMHMNQGLWGLSLFK
jgi:Ser/Thr protein kinase RdoA (MazF antagonist)